MKLTLALTVLSLACSATPSFALGASTTTRSAGATVVVQPVPAADLVGTEVVLQAGLDRQSPRQNGLAALVAEAILHTPSGSSIAGKAASLQEAVTANGGSITYAVEPRHIRFYLEGLPQGFASSVALFRTALGHPDFSAVTLKASRAALNQKIEENQHLALSVGIDMLNRAFYQNSDAGMPPYGMPQTLAVFSTEDARAFYAQHYRRGDAIISVIGNIAGASSADFTGFADGLPPGSSAPISARIAKLPSNSQQIIAHRDVPVPWLVAQYPAPDIRSNDFGAMLILTAFMQRTLGDVSEAPAIATRGSAQRGVGAFYNFDTYPANVIIYVDGGLGDPTRTFATALTVVNVLGHAKMGGDLTSMKAFAAGRLLEDTQTLQDRAWLAGVFASRRQNGDYVATMLRAINSTTSADLQRVAARYLGAPTIALVLPRAQPTVQSPTP
jgi:predicted Zn-dependent peptidase